MSTPLHYAGACYLRADCVENNLGGRRKLLCSNRILFVAMAQLDLECISLQLPLNWWINPTRTITIRHLPMPRACDHRLIVRTKHFKWAPIRRWDAQNRMSYCEHANNGQWLTSPCEIIQTYRSDSMSNFIHVGGTLHVQLILSVGNWRVCVYYLLSSAKFCDVYQVNSLLGCEQILI